MKDRTRMPDIDQHLCLGGEPIEHFAIEQFVAKRPVEPQAGEARLSL
ncbi:hypothetical protein [Sphingobium sp. LSP13-1-1.1]|jgi:hypothetical protein